jgi:hypothetical protein
MTYITKAKDREEAMEVIDKRIVNRMSFAERMQYEEEIYTQLPDCMDKCEHIDIELLMAQIPLRGRIEEVPPQVQEQGE